MGAGMGARASVRAANAAKWACALRRRGAGFVRGANYDRRATAARQATTAVSRARLHLTAFRQPWPLRASTAADRPGMGVHRKDGQGQEEGASRALPRMHDGGIWPPAYGLCALAARTRCRVASQVSLSHKRGGRCAVQAKRLAR